VGLVLAYISTPLVLWLEKHLPPRKKWPHFKHLLSVVIVFIGILSIAAGFFYLIFSTITGATLALVDNAPSLFQRIQLWAGNLLESLPPEIQDTINLELSRIGANIGEGMLNALMTGISTVLQAYNVIIGFAVLPFFLYYILRDSESLKKSLASFLPFSIGFHGKNIAAIIGLVLGRYIKAQGTLGFIVGFFTFIGLLLMRVPYPLALGVVAGFTEMIPTFGPWIGGAVAVFVTLAMTPDKVLWVILLFLGIQLLENNLLVPRIQSAYFHIHPAVMIVLLVFGTYIAGIWGLVLIGPVTATVVEIFKYMRDFCDGKPCQLPDLHNTG
jgi:predicted PurR-regulated permease PerM